MNLRCLSVDRDERTRQIRIFIEKVAFIAFFRRRVSIAREKQKSSVFEVQCISTEKGAVCQT